jgi:hypothetical protein
MKTYTNTVAVGLAVFTSLAYGAAIPASSKVDTRADSGIWQPKVGQTWQIVINQPFSVGTGKLNPDVDIYDIDLFENTKQGRDNSTIVALHKLGKRVICYINSGAWQPGHPDNDRFQQSDLGAVMEGWEEEKWLDIRSQNVRNIMADRIALAAQLGCDAVDPDNTDGSVYTPYSLLIYIYVHD